MPIESAPTAPAVTAAHDASVFDGGIAGPVCFPETTEEVQAIMRIAEQHGSAVVPRGAGTGLAGGAIPLGRPVVVSTGRMNKVLSVDTNNRIAWVQPGVINLDLSKKLQPKGSTSPPTRQANRSARSAAMSPIIPEALTASPTASPMPTSCRWKSYCPTGRSPCSVAPRTRPPASTFAAPS